MKGWAIGVKQRTKTIRFHRAPPGTFGVVSDRGGNRTEFSRDIPVFFVADNYRILTPRLRVSGVSFSPFPTTRF